MHLHHVFVNKVVIVMKLSNNLSIDALLNMYADQGFDTFQLKQIEEGLEQGLDVSVYAKKSHSDRLMSFALYLLNAHVNLEYALENDRLNANLLLERYRQLLWLQKIKPLRYEEIMLLLKDAYTDQESE